METVTIGNIYFNGLATDRFAGMLDDPTQCYKFYWLDAVMELLPVSENGISFDDIFDEMICAAWYSVTEFHLRLGPVVNGKPVNLLERAVHSVENDPDIPQPAGKQDILSAIKRNRTGLKNCKEALAKNVPYRILSSFMDKVGGDDRIWDQKGKLIKYIRELNDEIRLPYTVIDGKGFQKKICIDPQWEIFMRDNYTIIRSWIRLKKVQYLQDRNPGVPGIIYKLENSHGDVRKLEEARKLWSDVSAATGRPLKDIYTGKELEETSFALDHFVPWSYVANDELWNLTPSRQDVNSSKGSRLPQWGRFFVPFAENQYDMYKAAFSAPVVRDQFERCRRNNLNSIWASEMLYIEGNTRENFRNVLEQYLRPVYESARLQGYRIWKTA